MKLFALGDPHLSFNEAGEEYKPMGIFGDCWKDHGYKIKERWTDVVGEDDVVLLPGDISWAMDLKELEPDLQFLATLPGRKIISKGNHDYWWESLSKIKSVMPEGFEILQNNSFVFGDTSISGTRGWQCPETAFSDAHDEKIFYRELGRLRMSLESVPKEVRHKIVMLHYPPVNGKKEESAFISVMQEFGVELCLYGHLHSYAIQNALEGEHWGIRFELVSADRLDFKPKAVWELDEKGTGHLL